MSSGGATSNPCDLQVYDAEMSGLQRHTVRSMNGLVALFFAVDAIMKMIAQGVLLTPTAYFQVSPMQESSSNFAESQPY